MSAYFAYQQAESTGYFGYHAVFWFLVMWAWVHAALMYHGVYEGRQKSAVYGGVAFALYGLAAAVWLIVVMRVPGSG